MLYVVYHDLSGFKISGFWAEHRKTSTIQLIISQKRDSLLKKLYLASTQFLKDVEVYH